MMRSTGILPVAQPWKPAYAAWAAGTGHMVSFQALFLPATSQCQRVLLMTHPRGFYKGQVSGPCPEEKQPWCCESEPQRAPWPWRASAGPGALPGLLSTPHEAHLFHQTFTPPPRLTPACFRWSCFSFEQVGDKIANSINAKVNFWKVKFWYSF